MRGVVLSNRVRILNGQFDRLTLSEAADQLMSSITRGERGWLVTVNVAILMMMRDDPFLQQFAERARMVVADGQPLVWVAPLLGQPLPERVAGVDLVGELSSRAADAGVPIYLLGAGPTVAEAVAESLRSQFPKLEIAGTADGYFTEDEAPARARAIRESGACILFVAMGVPRQERFIEKYWDDFGVNLAVPVGGSFDVLAGQRARAPRMVQKIGMEWAFRLAQEPRRLFKRYLVTNAQFTGLVGRELLSRYMAGN